MLLDIDFIVSEELAAELDTENGWAALMRRLQAGTAVALPAFETPYDVTGAWRLQSGAVEGGTAVAFQAAAGGQTEEGGNRALGLRAMWRSTQHPGCEVSPLCSLLSGGTLLQTWLCGRPLF